MNGCDICGHHITPITCIDVWDENGAWLRYCSWKCLHAAVMLRRGA